MRRDLFNVHFDRHRAQDEILAARMSEKRTATKYCIGLEKKFGMGKLYAAMRGTPS